MRLDPFTSSPLQRSASASPRASTSSSPTWAESPEAPVEAAWPSSQLEQSELSRFESQSVTPHSGFQGGGRAPAPEVVEMSRAGLQHNMLPRPFEPRQPIGLGLTQVPGLQNANLPSLVVMASLNLRPTAVAAPMPQPLVGLGIERVDVGPTGAQIGPPLPERYTYQSPPPEPEVPFAWGQHVRQHAERGRDFSLPRTPLSPPTPQVARRGSEGAVFPDTTLSPADLRGLFSTEYRHVPDLEEPENASDEEQSARSSRSASPSLPGRQSGMFADALGPFSPR